MLTSSPVNFAYQFCSTNNHVVMAMVACLPLPEISRHQISALAALTIAALDRGRNLISVFEALGVDRARALRSGIPQLDPVIVLLKKKLPQVRVKTWVERGWVQTADSDSMERFTVGVLSNRGKLVPQSGRGVKETLEIWISAYGDMKWNRFENQLVPDDPTAFREVWITANNDVHSALAQHEKSISNIDDAVSRLYRLSDNLRELLKIGPPWLARRAGMIADNDEDDEDQPGVP